MKRIVTLTAFAVSVILSPAAFAHGSYASSHGNATAQASAFGLGAFAARDTQVISTSSADSHGAHSFTKASSMSIGTAVIGAVSVGGSASGGTSASFGGN